MHSIAGLDSEINHYFMNSQNELNSLVAINEDCVSKEEKLNLVAYSHEVK